MKNVLSAISPGTFISQLMTGYIAYYLLMTDNCLHCSIATLIEYGHSLPVNKHLILLGLLPIYIAFVIFGSALLSAALGKWLENIIMRPFRQRKSKISY
jgi:hypothetical protein